MRVCVCVCVCACVCVFYPVLFRSFLLVYHPGGLLVRGKRACTMDCSPNVAKKRRACLSPLVPNSISHSHYGELCDGPRFSFTSHYPPKNAAQEQVVPALSPQEEASVCKFEEYRRKEKESVKPFDLFNGDDIFAPSHEE